MSEAARTSRYGRTFGRAIVGLLLMSSAAAVVAAERADAESLEVEVAVPVAVDTVAADSIAVTVSWAPAEAFDGAQISHYVWTLFVNDAPAADGVVQAQAPPFSVQAVVARPEPGQMMVVHAEVQAVDTRGVQGVLGSSAPFRISTPARPPSAPVIEIDTLAVAPPISMSYDSLRIVAPSEDLAADGTLYLEVGEDVTLCAIGYREGQGYILPNEQVAWASSDSTVVLPEFLPGIPAECQPLGYRASRQFSPFRSMVVRRSA